jgi:hypothetical protein
MEMIPWSSPSACENSPLGSSPRHSFAHAADSPVCVRSRINSRPKSAKDANDGCVDWIVQNEQTDLPAKLPTNSIR